MMLNKIRGKYDNIVTLFNDTVIILIPKDAYLSIEITDARFKTKLMIIEALEIFIFSFLVGK